VNELDASDSKGRSYPRLKVLYLLATCAVAFVVPAVEQTRAVRWYVVPGLIGLQVLILLIARVSPLDILRTATRLKWLFVFLIACYVLLPGNSEANDTIVTWQPVQVLGPIAVNLTGLEAASLMCLQIVTVILVSAVVRLTGRSADLVDGLRGFGMPRLFVYSIDATLAMLGVIEQRGTRGGGRGMGGGGGGGRRREAKGTESEKTARWAEGEGNEESTTRVQPAPSPSALRSLVRGDVGVFVRSIEQSLVRARERVDQGTGAGLDPRFVNDVAVISGIALAMMSLKMLKVLPGVPFLPGWKTLFFYPLYILAAHLTHSRWGATTAGTIMGVLGYLQGDGKYGALEILKHLVPGLAIDLTWPAVRRLPRSAFVFCVLGFVAAIARTTTEFATMLLLQVRLEAYAVVLPTLATNLVAGTLSGLVTHFVLPAVRGSGATLPVGPAGSTTTCAVAQVSNPANLFEEMAGGLEACSKATSLSTNDHDSNASPSSEHISPRACAITQAEGNVTSEPEQSAGYSNQPAG